MPNFERFLDKLGCASAIDGKTSLSQGLLKFFSDHLIDYINELLLIL